MAQVERQDGSPFLGLFRKYCQLPGKVGVFIEWLYITF